MKAAWTLLLLAAPAMAQLQLAVETPDGDRAVSALYDSGNAAPGEKVETRFRLTNTSAAGVTLTKLSVTGEGFAVFDGPVPPRIIAPGLSVEFSLRFAPAKTGAYQGLLTVNTLMLELRGTAAAMPVMAWQSGEAWTALQDGSTLDFGTVQADIPAKRMFRLENHTTVALEAAAPAIGGNCFRFPAPWGGPVTIAAGNVRTFEVEARSDAPGTCEADLTWSGRVFHLRAVVLEPPLPRPAMELPATAESGKQLKVAVKLESAAKRAADGTLWLKFIPASGLPEESAIAFVPSLARSIPFHVREGQAAADFSSGDGAVVQTGTTAGTLVLTAVFGGVTVERRVEIAAARVGVDQAQALLAANIAEVQVRGFDNARTLGKLSFTFYLKDGSPLVQGKIEADATEAFRKFYAANESAGGAFQLRVSFPVSGTSSQLESVAVVLTNGMGATETGRLRF